MELEFKKYEELDVTIQTWVVYSNITIDNEKLFETIVCRELKSPLPRHQKRMLVNSDEKLENGDVVFAEYLGLMKGRIFRKPKEKQMRNCATIIMKLDAEDGKPVKFYNIKISKRGNFQITGCTSESTVKKIVQHLWTLLNKRPGLYTFNPAFKTNDFTCYICCRMHNVRFSLPLMIKLRELNNTIKMIPEIQEFGAQFSSTYEPSIGYGGVNVKITSFIESIRDAKVTKCICSKGKFEFFQVQFSEYLHFLSPREVVKKTTKVPQNSFLVFSSGKIIMSGTFSEKNREHSYLKFCELFIRYQSLFTVPLTNDK